MIYFMKNDNSLSYINLYPSAIFFKIIYELNKISN